MENQQFYCTSFRFNPEMETLLKLLAKDLDLSVTKALEKLVTRYIQTRLGKDRLQEILRTN